MRHVFETMGTVASMEVPVGFELGATDVERAFGHIDERFSLYRTESELSRINRGELSLSDASPRLLAAYERSLEWRDATNGLFSVHRPDGAIDLNGIVKAEAIEQAGAMLDAAECPAWTINVGGDILVRGVGWSTGVSDPADLDSLLTAVDLGAKDRRALATSGSAQRGDHIWRGAELAPSAFVQVSVMAADIVTADVLATAIVAGGPDALDDITDRWAVHVLTVDRAGALLATPGFRPAIGLLAS